MANTLPEKMKKSEQYILFVIGILIVAIGILSFLYIDRRLSLVPEVTVETPSNSGNPSYVVVHVAGRVKKPGVYKLPFGARVYEAVEAAGGNLRDADMDSINLARTLRDGEKIFIPQKTSSNTVMSTREKRIDINTMGKEELLKLPGVGEKLAERIIKYRETHGPFRDIDELKNVSGIGDKKLKEIKDYLNSL